MSVRVPVAGFHEVVMRPPALSVRERRSSEGRYPEEMTTEAELMVR